MKKGKRNIFIRFLLPYMVLLLITGAMGLFMSRKTHDSVMDGALEVNKAVLAQTNILVDQYLREMEDTVVHMAFNPSLTRCLNMRKPLSSQDYYYLFEAQRSLSLQGLKNNFVTHYYVCLESSDTVLLPDTAYTRPRLFFDQYLEGSRPDGESPDRRGYW